MTRLSTTNDDRPLDTDALARAEANLDQAIAAIDTDTPAHLVDTPDAHTTTYSIVFDVDFPQLFTAILTAADATTPLDNAQSSDTDSSDTTDGSLEPFLPDDHSPTPTSP